MHERVKIRKKDDRFTAHHVIHAHMLVRCLIYRQRKSSFCFLGSCVHSSRTFLAVQCKDLLPVMLGAHFEILEAREIPITELVAGMRIRITTFIFK